MHIRVFGSIGPTFVLLFPLSFFVVVLVSLRTGAGGLAFADLSAKGAGEAAVEGGKAFEGAGDGFGCFGDAFVVDAEQVDELRG